MLFESTRHTAWEIIVDEFPRAWLDILADVFELTNVSITDPSEDHDIMAGLFVAVPAVLPCVFVQLLFTVE